MLKHIVLLKFTSDTPDDHIETFRTKMKALLTVMPEMKSLEFGVDTVKGNYSWHVAMTMTFESVDDLQYYQKHPDHQAIAEANKHYLVDIASVDYFVSDSR